MDSLERLLMLIIIVFSLEGPNSKKMVTLKLSETYLIALKVLFNIQIIFHSLTLSREINKNVYHTLNFEAIIYINKNNYHLTINIKVPSGRHENNVCILAGTSIEILYC